MKKIQSPSLFHKQMAKPNRPKNGYMRWLTEHIDEMREQHPEANTKEIVRIAGGIWQLLPSTVKDGYNEAYQRALPEYQRAMAEYHRYHETRSSTTTVARAHSIIVPQDPPEDRPTPYEDSVFIDRPTPYGGDASIDRPTLY